MRTSNKILLGGFVAMILIITSIHVVLYAKIKNGDLITFREIEDAGERIVLGNVKYVSITGFVECRIVPGDTAAIEVGRNWLKSFKYRVVGDSLFVEGGLREAEYVMGSRVDAPITLYLPPVESITANYSKVFLRGAEDSTNAISRTILINNSELNVTATTRELKPAYWKSLQVNALNSQTIFTEGAVVNELSVNLLSKSSLTDAGADLQHFSLQVDSTSTVSLRKKSLQNIKLVK